MNTNKTVKQTKAKEKQNTKPKQLINWISELELRKPQSAFFIAIAKVSKNYSKRKV